MRRETLRLSLSLPCKVDYSAAAVQPGGSCGARIGGTSRYNTVRLRRRPWHLQRRLHALGAATNHHGANAPRTHASPGEPQQFDLQAAKINTAALKDTLCKAKLRLEGILIIHSY